MDLAWASDRVLHLYPCTRGSGEKVLQDICKSLCRTLRIHVKFSKDAGMEVEQAVGCMDVDLESAERKEGEANEQPKLKKGKFWVLEQGEGV